MPTSPVLQQKIFATKKRLSEPLFSEHMIWCLGLCCLLAVLLCAGRLVTLGSQWGLITFDIPVASEPFNDQNLNRFKEQPSSTMNQHSVVLALTPSELIFGDVASFTSQKNDVRNKFSVRHADGSPQVSEALKQIETWTEDRKRRQAIRSDGILLLLPDPAVPIAIVSVVAQQVRSSKKFDHVILGGGVL